MPDCGQEVNHGPQTWADYCARAEHVARPHLSRTRKYLNQTIHGPFREAQRFLNLKLQQRDLSLTPRAAAITLNQFLDQWLATSAKPRLRARTFHDYESLLRLYIRPVLGMRLIGTIGQMEMQGLYAQLFARGLSARTIEYTNAVLESSFRQRNLIYKRKGPSSRIGSQNGRLIYRTTLKAVASDDGAP